MLVEADLAGGVIAVRYGLGREPGPHDPRRVWNRRARRVASSTPRTPAASRCSSVRTRPKQRGRCGEARATGSRQRLDRVDAAAVVVDLGRLGAGSPHRPARGPACVVVVRPVAEHLVTLCHRLPTLRRTRRPAQVGVVLVGEGPYRPGDVVVGLGVDVLGDLPTTLAPPMRSSMAARSPAASTLAVSPAAVGDGAERRPSPGARYRRPRRGRPDDRRSTRQWPLGSRRRGRPRAGRPASTVSSATRSPSAHSAQDGARQGRLARRRTSGRWPASSSPTSCAGWPATPTRPGGTRSTRPPRRPSPPPSSTGSTAWPDSSRCSTTRRSATSTSPAAERVWLNLRDGTKVRGPAGRRRPTTSWSNSSPPRLAGSAAANAAGTTPIPS